MGRKKRKRVIRRKVKHRTSFYFCPNCQNTSLSITYLKNKKAVKFECYNCHLERTYEMEEGEEPIDTYSRFIDDFHSS